MPKKRRTAHFRMGQKIGEFVLEKMLGGGQDGEVWLAVKETLNKEFAIKFLNSIDDHDKTDRFEREISILSRLNHPYVISISHKDTAWNPTTGKIVPFYVMDFLDALPLDKYLDGVDSNALRKTFCQLFVHVGQALLEIHDRGITHGDLKPANILVLRTYGVPKITDFGFGLLPGEKGEKRTQYPESSYRTPQGLSEKESDIYKIVRAFKDCHLKVQSKLSETENAQIESMLDDLEGKPESSGLRLTIAAIDDFAERQGDEEYFYNSIWGTHDSTMPEIGEGQVDFILRDSFVGFLGISTRVREILDLPEFQRQRYISPLFSASLVFPSLIASEFEFAIGRFAMTVQMIKSLTKDDKMKGALDKRHIRALLLSSLLLGLGQMPFGRQIYLATEDQQFDIRVRSSASVASPDIAAYISKTWDLEPDMIMNMLRGQIPFLNPRPWQLANSILEGAIDAGKIDSTIRILGKTGMSTSFDIIRLVRSLRISPNQENIVVDIKGIRELEGYLIDRYRILEYVMYHSTVRAADSMLMEAFFELSSLGVNFQMYANMDDWVFYSEIMKVAQERKLARAHFLLNSVKLRKLHKKVFEWTRSEVGRVEFDPADKSLSVRKEQVIAKAIPAKFPSGSIIFVAPKYLSLGGELILSVEGETCLADSKSVVIQNIIHRIHEDLGGKYQLYCSKDAYDSVVAIGRQELSRIIFGTQDGSPS